MVNQEWTNSLILNKKNEISGLGCMPSIYFALYQDFPFFTDVSQLGCKNYVTKRNDRFVLTDIPNVKKKLNSN